MKFQEFEDKMKKIRMLDDKIKSIKTFLKEAQGWREIKIKQSIRTSEREESIEINIGLGVLKNGLIEACNILINDYNKLVEEFENAGVEFESEYKNIKPIPNFSEQLEEANQKINDLVVKSLNQDFLLEKITKERDNYYKLLKEFLPEKLKEETNANNN